LILKTPENSSFYGMYDFPGGRIDEDEFKTDYIEILKRELYEEA
jgi:8-oxo-dGTP pyrophosphatase MutT (NUDIX family)